MHLESMTFSIESAKNYEHWIQFFQVRRVNVWRFFFRCRYLMIACYLQLWSLVNMVRFDEQVKEDATPVVATCSGDQGDASTNGAVISDSVSESQHPAAETVVQQWTDSRCLYSNRDQLVFCICKRLNTLSSACFHDYWCHFYCCFIKIRYKYVDCSIYL